MMEGIRVHCPNCGVEFLVIPQVAGVDHVEGKRILFAWFTTEFEHRCG
jgi:hypothetical protein